MFSYKIRLLNYCGQTSYNVTLIHSAQARMSAAMVTNGANQLQAVAHLIGTDQLPIPESVSTKRHIQIVQVVWIRYMEFCKA